LAPEDEATPLFIYVEAIVLAGDTTQTVEATVEV